MSLRNVCYEAWQSHFLFLPANSKTCLRSCDIVIFGTDSFRRVFQLALQPCSFSVLSLTKTWIPFALQKSCGPFTPELHILWCFLDSPWILRTSLAFLTLLFCVQHPDFHWPGSSVLPWNLSWYHGALEGVLSGWLYNCVTSGKLHQCLGLCFFSARHIGWIKLCVRGPSYWRSMLWSVGTFKSSGMHCSVENELNQCAIVCDNNFDFLTQ